MDPITDNSDEHSGNPDSSRSTSIGKILRDSRESLGYSISDVAAQIKFAPRQIEALEADDFESLPETAFLRGFVRSYAKILHIDANDVLKYMPQAKREVESVHIKAPESSSAKEPFPGILPSHRQNMIMLVSAVLMAVIVVGFAVWQFSSPAKEPIGKKMESQVTLPSETQALSMSQDVNKEETKSTHQNDATTQPLKETEKASPQKEKSASSQEKQNNKSEEEVKNTEAMKIEKAKVDQAESETPSTSQPETKMATDESPNIVASPTRGGRVRLVFDEESWTEITGYDGKLLSSQIYSRGSELSMEVPLPLSLVIGHAGTTHLYLDGEPVDLKPFISRSSDVARLTLE